MLVTVPSRRDQRTRTRGQSLAELALVLPVILLIVMMSLDFGRAFFSWVTITNASRAAANYAAINPADTYPNAAYTARLNQELTTNQICPLTGSTTPTWIDGPDANGTTKDFGDSVRVSISCNFRILTPIVGSIVGNNLPMRAETTFPIRVGAL